MEIEFTPNKQCVIMCGAPCSGKSTIGKQLASAIGYEYISSGDVARQMAMVDPHTLHKINGGNLAPEDKMRDQMKQIISNSGDIILDGMPRFIDQYDWLMATFGDTHEFVMVHVAIEISQAQERARSRGREDDAAFHKRLKFFCENTHPMMIHARHYMDIISVPGTVPTDLAVDILKFKLSKF